VPVPDLLLRVLAPPALDHVGDAGYPHAEDERQARSLDVLLVLLRHHARIRDDGEVRELVGGHERGDDRQHGLGLGFVAFEGGHHQREAVGAGEQADGDLWFQTAFLGEPRFAEPVALVSLEIQRGYVGPGLPVPGRRGQRRQRRPAAARNLSRKPAAAA
jgi:hypothetical protein